ncbi:hypothetical protein [Congzhengia minquanensis]|uniref:AcrIC5-like domain-containing protein n=1 Tax=Congzhengia minquanensis TaxID=2763657 RepID=A0A926DN95_9FIRM|nr:hypothetical protein [Congzhengia minquanensis]MBC8540817.1 hypothetical protein [Congzhengia minquanensis]
MKTNVNTNKKEFINWDAIVSYMDDEIRETVHAELAPCSEHEFLKRYLELDPEFKKLLKDEFNMED